MTQVWIRYDRNIQLEMDGFYISYNGDTGADIPIFAGDEPAETALVKDGRYYILNGDWRYSYERLVDKGFDACYRFYLKQKGKHGSSWSNDDLVLERALEPPQS